MDFVLKSSSGQSLVELLVAIGVGAVLFVGTATLVAPTLQINKTTSQVQAAAALGKELSDNVRVWSEGDWHDILNLATGTAHTYYLITSSSPFTATSGIESIQVSTTTYTRFFYVNDVYRDGSGNATSSVVGNTYDPSTKQVTVTYNWTRGTTTTLIIYLTRNRTDVLDQTDWSGGPGEDGPITLVNAQFTSSTQIGYSVPGVITAESQWSNGYAYRRTITISSTLISPASHTALTDFPMLIGGTYSWLADTDHGGDVQNTSGYDIVFTSDASGTQPLDYERESYSSSTGAVDFWVKVPTLSSTSDMIYMFYDSPSVVTDQSHGSSTWDSNYVAVYHLADGTTLSGKDSTANGYNLINSSTVAASGEIDGAGNFVTTSGGMYNTSFYNVTSSDITLSAWIDPSSSTFNGSFGPSVINWEGNPQSLGISVNGWSNIYGGILTTQGSWGPIAPGTPANHWSYVAVTYDGTNERMYVDGALAETNAASGTIKGNTLYIGDFAYGTSYQGIIDEAHMSDAARSADWIATEYNNQSDPSTFYSLGDANTNLGIVGEVSSSSAKHWAWNDSLGWIDFYKVGVNSSGLTGYASSSLGDVSLDCATTRNGNVCNGAYRYRRAITMASNLIAPSGTALSNFPVLISGTYSYLAASSSGGYVQNPNGYDIMFSSDASGTDPLAYERESYDSASGAAAFWVNIPTLSSSSNVIYLFYDNPSITTDQSDAAAAWNKDYITVDHYGNGGNLSGDDSTANGYILTNSSTLAVTGEIGGGASFTSSSAMSSMMYNNSFYSNTLSQFTISLWLNPSSTSFNGSYGPPLTFWQTIGCGCGGAAGIQLYGNNSVYAGFFGSGGSVGLISNNTPAGQWSFAVLTYDGSTARLYVNGTLASSQAVSATMWASEWIIGDSYTGSIDETRFSDISRSSDWIATEYNNESDPSAFYSIGSAVAQNAYSASDYQVLNDGWGDLSGWAWNDAIGWISFCGGKSTATCPGTTTYETTIDQSGNFQGWAWNDAVGWISFNCDNMNACATSNYEVATNWLPTPPTITGSGELDSAIFDTGVASGSQFNSILWQGVATASSTVQFQLAASNSSSGPWNYEGVDGTANTFYTPVGPGASVKVNENDFSNDRYFRYRVFISSVNGTSSQVNNVVVNWSP